MPGALSGRAASAPFSKGRDAPNAENKESGDKVSVGALAVTHIITLSVQHINSSEINIFSSR
jgi:hypothetical protein